MNEKPWYIPETRDILAIFLVASVVAVTFLVLIRPPAADNQLGQVLVGALVTTGLAAIIGYYFGSSSSSKDKDNTISSMAIKTVTPTDIKTDSTTVQTETATVVEK